MGSSEFVVTILTLVVLVGIFFMARELMAWYWKINEHLKLEKEILDELKKINKREELKKLIDENK